MRLREHLWLGYLSKCHIKITSYKENTSQSYDDEYANTDYENYFSYQRQFIDKSCNVLSRFSAPCVLIEWHDANYQTLEPFGYLPNVETNFSGVPPIYVKYLQKSSQGQEPNRSQRSYHDLEILVWSQCDSIANLGQAWAYLKKSDGSQKRPEAWDIISGHGYENCVQQVCPRLLYKAWECIENDNLEDLQDWRSSLLRTIEDLATSRKRRWEILEWPRSKEVGGRAAQGGAPDNTLSFSI